MNFDLTPSPSWSGAFWFALALMAASSLALLWLFKRAGWL